MKIQDQIGQFHKTLFQKAKIRAEIVAHCESLGFHLWPHKQNENKNWGQGDANEEGEDIPETERCGERLGEGTLGSGGWFGAVVGGEVFQLKRETEDGPDEG